jgi:hypothetical protein
VTTVTPPPRRWLSPDRIWLYGISLALIGCGPSIVLLARSGPGFWINTDWQAFWAAGATVGTPDLLNPSRHTAWQLAHHVLSAPFVYPPAVAWAFRPLAALPPDIGFFVNALVMALSCIASAVIASRVYGIRPSVAILMMIAWSPCMTAGLQGQISPIALLLTMLAIQLFLRAKQAGFGAVVGLLLFKPADALPLFALIVARKLWAAAFVVLAIAAAWYLASVTATAGDWQWPIHSLRAISDWFAADAARNIDKAVSLPLLLVRFGVRPLIANAIGIAILAAVIPLLARAGRIESASMAPLVGLATSSHAWQYEAVLAMPAIYWAATTLREPWRTPVLASAYVLSAMWMLLVFIHFDPLFIVIVGGAGAWVAFRFRTLRDGAPIRGGPESAGF